MICLNLELWLEWLQDEMGLVSDESSREEVTKLFEKSVEDYLCELGIQCIIMISVKTLLCRGLIILPPQAK